MTTLDRLHKKGVLDRVSEGRAFRYSPRRSESEFNNAVARNVVRQLLGSLGRNDAPISFLVDAVGEYDRQLLDEMERAIERKKKELKAQQRKEKR
jgi:predicted transcriptional regulator